MELNRWSKSAHKINYGKTPHTLTKDMYYNEGTKLKEFDIQSEKI